MGGSLLQRNLGGKSYYISKKYNSDGFRYLLIFSDLFFLPMASWFDTFWLVSYARSIFSHWGTKAELLWGSELIAKRSRGDVSFCDAGIILWKTICFFLMAPFFMHWGTKAELLWGSELIALRSRGEVSFCDAGSRSFFHLMNYICFYFMENIFGIIS